MMTITVMITMMTMMLRGDDDSDDHDSDDHEHDNLMIFYDCDD